MLRFEFQVGSAILPVLGVIGRLSHAHVRALVTAPRVSTSGMFHVKPSRILCHTSASDVASINRLSPILAIAVGVFHAGLAAVFTVVDVKPNLLLVATVIVAASWGPVHGATWAFVGGLTANVLSGEPMGSVPLTLLAAAALTAGAAPAFTRLPLLYPVIAAFAGSIVADLGMLLIRQLVEGGEWRGLPLELLLGAATVNAGLAALLFIPARLLVRRREPSPHVVSRWPT